LVRSSSVHSRRRKRRDDNRKNEARRGFLSKVCSPVYSSGIDWSNFVVAETKDGDIIGCARIKQHSENVREIATVSVVKAWRGKGVANAGLKFILANYPRPLWGTCLNNLVPYYKKLGAREVTEPGQMPAFFRRRQRFFNILLSLFRSRKRLAVIVL
jgi:hypothetical protein